MEVSLFSSMDRATIGWSVGGGWLEGVVLCGCFGGGGWR